LLKPLCSDSVWEALPEKLVVLSDGMFKYFCEQACEVVSRIRIDDKTGVVAQGALFDQEQVPSETLFYSVLFADENRAANTKKALRDGLDGLADGVLQIGGDASIGLGYCSVEVFS
jgi:CRISPR-associated protein Cmr4